MRSEWRHLGGVPRAIVELARARRLLGRLDPAELTASVSFRPAEASSETLPEEVARVAWLVPRVAARLPWRADCLVQALAARHWLAGLGHDTSLHLGSRMIGGSLDAHAWLTWRGKVITGGRVDEFAVFTAPGDPAARH